MDCYTQETLGMIDRSKLGLSDYSTCYRDSLGIYIHHYGDSTLPDHLNSNFI